MSPRPRLGALSRAAQRFLGCAFLALGALGCSKNALLDITMSGAPHAAPPRGMRVGDRLILAGDLHCHVLPPDSPSHVSRELPDALEMAKEESLDFVVLTPHVPARFFLDDELRSWVLVTQAQLRARIARLHPDLLVIPGFEYTDHRYGHVGASFADPALALAGLSSAEARLYPERFFERWVAQGGLLTINHPVNRAMKNPPFSELGYDMSWRAFQGVPVPAEVAWITAHAQSIETFNAGISHLRDQFFLDDEERSLREAAAIVDRLVRAQRRPIAAVGGSDSHGHWLRATTYVLATERTPEAVRDAIASARTCVRGPEACTLQVRDGGTSDGEQRWLGVGDSLHASGSGGASATVEARARGGDVTFVVNGAIVARAQSGESAVLPVPPDRCTIVRAIVGRSWSSGVYVNCAFERGEGEAR